MNVYKFYDWDCYTNQDIEMSKSEYFELIRTCFIYSTTMSFIFKSNSIELEHKLKRFEINRPHNITYDFDHYRSLKTLDIKYYRVCDALYEIMLNSVENVFEWICGWGHNNPEDPTFYRSDGSVFFTSTIHEGNITLYLEDNEIIPFVIDNCRWKIQLPTNIGKTY